MVVDERGNAYALWFEVGQVGDAGLEANSLLFRLYDQAAASWSTAAKVTTAQGSISNPAVAARGGHAVAACSQAAPVAGLAEQSQTGGGIDLIARICR